MNIYRVETSQGQLEWARPDGDGFLRVKGNLTNGFQPLDESVDVESLRSPVLPENIFGIGLNYRGHVEEGGRDVPAHPQAFLKATSSVIGPEDSIRLPESAPDYVDYEAELALVIGRRARNISQNEASDYIAGYTIAIDVSARDCQKHDLQWVRAKSFDSFCPLGPCLSTTPPDGSIEGRLNGTVMQNASFSEMIFPPAEIVEYLSRQFTLLPGTVILTGTPSGVGFAQDPPRYLEAGDTYEVTVPGIGTLSVDVERDQT